MFFYFEQLGCPLKNFLVLLFVLPFGISSQDYKRLTNQEITEVLESIRIKRGNDSISDSKFMEIVECATDGKCIPSQRELIVNEIIIRKSVVGYGEGCKQCYTRPTDEPLLCMKLFRPLPTIGEVGSSKKAYETWQKEIVGISRYPNHPACDHLQNLYCDGQLRCACLEGSTWDSLLNKCVIPIQSSCKFNTEIYLKMYESNLPPKTPASLEIPKYYDPLSPLAEYKSEKIILPQCSSNSSGAVLCSRFRYFGDPLCVNQAIIVESEKLEKYFDTVTNTVYGEKCNFEEHQHLYGLPGHDKTVYDNRFKRLNSLKQRKNTFCDLKKFLTCSFSNKCECMLQAVYKEKEKKCILPPPYDFCEKGIDSLLKNESITEEAKMSIGKAFADMSKCVGDNHRCYFDSSDVDDMESYCSCPIGKTGKKCDERLTKFINHVRPPSYAHDVSDYDEKVKLFDVLNNVAIKFEVIFKIPENGPCDPLKDIEIERAERFLRNLASSKAGKVTKMNYINMATEIKRLTNRHEKDFTCNRLEFPDLRCIPSKKQCTSVSAKDYLDDLVFTLRAKIQEVLKCGEKCNKINLGRPNDDYLAGVDELANFWLAGNFKMCISDISYCGDSSAGNKAGKCICRDNPNEGFENGCDKFSSNANNSLQIILILSLIVFFD